MGDAVLRTKKPHIVERSDPPITPILAISCIFSSGKASNPMNRLIVNPMPAITETPYRCIHPVSSGLLAKRSFINIHVVPKIPICLPRNKPSAIPSGSGCMMSGKEIPEKLTPALVKAKIGSTRKLTHGWSK